MATFGEGDPTDNAAEFYKWIMAEDRNDDLRGSIDDIKYAVFALGNKQYEHYCAVGKKLDKRLFELGGKRLIDHGEGDDDGTLEDDFRSWKKGFWKEAKKQFLGVEGDGEAEVEIKFVPSLALEWEKEGKTGEKGGDDEKKESYVGGITGFVAENKHHTPVIAMTAVNKELRQYVETEETKEYGSITTGSTRHIEFDLSGTELKYETADNLGVYPRNDYKFAARLAKRLCVKQHDIFLLKRAPKTAGGSGHDVVKFPTPKRCSVEDALLWYCDFMCLCSLSMLTILAQYSKDEIEKEKIIAPLKSKEAAEQFHADQKSIYDILMEYPSIQPPFVDFLEFVPKLIPRFYTIASSALVQPTRVALTVTVDTVDLPRGRKHFGICSNYLFKLREGKEQALVFVRPSTFRFPRSLPPHSSSVPIIMIGPGSGLAPFRAFIQEANYLKEKGVDLGTIQLYFGCRNKTKDYIYQDEIESASNNKILSDLQLAFSRDGPNKIYVQDLLAAQGAAVWPLIQKEHAMIFVCGGTAMGRSIRETIIAMAEKYGGMGHDDAVQYFQTMQSAQRYIAELWS